MFNTQAAWKKKTFPDAILVFLVSLYLHHCLFVLLYLHGWLVYTEFLLQH